MRAVFDAQYQASRRSPLVDVNVRVDRLRRLQAMLDAHEQILCEAVEADFGVRSAALTEVADIFVLRSLIGQLLKNTRRWSQTRRVKTPIYLQPGHARVIRQPLGVVGVISPWNYPLQLAIGPAATAMAAGNRVMIKPSELTPHASALMARLIHENFAAEELSVQQGGADVAAEFASLPFDHLFFTGSTAVGRKVAAEAANNLTPTTLELGGKSPCIISPSADLDEAVVKIVHGKLINAGQTCIAPDYVLISHEQLPAFEAAWQAAVSKLFPTLAGNPDYAAIISDRHHARLTSLVEEARAMGARVVEAQAPDGPDGHGRQLRPVLLLDAPAQATILKEEIFGPVLPVVVSDTVAETIHYINERPRPLALYWFGKDTSERDNILRSTVSGGVTVNDTLMHIAHKNLAFGGIGESGWGAYHGETGFARFTHEKSVFYQSPLAMGHLFYPPYGERFRQVMGLIKRLL
ncbi:coniferyl aldehyde dehydrogenase [Hydrogenophaga sp. 5NK40-0174]